MKNITLSILAISVSLASFTANAMDSSNTSSTMKLTAVQYKNMQTEDNGPTTNDWATQAPRSNNVFATPRSKYSDLTAVQYKRAMTDSDGPESNDWATGELNSSSSAREGYTAVQFKRMQTENDGPNTNDWARG